MFIHDIIKINYINEGYLPNYPYHLITDREMIEAFLKPNEGYFAANYPCIDDSLADDYAKLLTFITDKLNDYIDNESEIPNWIYSYMIGSVISINSDPEDVYSLESLLNLDKNLWGSEFNLQLAKECLSVSKDWVKKLPSKYENRPPSMFGELHVIKSLRIDNISQ